MQVAGDSRSFRSTGLFAKSAAKKFVVERRAYTLYGFVEEQHRFALP